MIITQLMELDQGGASKCWVSRSMNFAMDGFAR